MTDPNKAVFLSYASQDAEAAQKLCNALRVAGIEVWFDRSELRGGDAWDALIRRQIKGCYLFVAIISANTQSREEGYFRREWKLAVDRTNDMAEDRAFLLPIIIDGTSDSEARVPEKFREVQWTRLPGGETPLAFVERIKRLLSPERTPLSAVSGAAPGLREPARASRRSKPVLFAAVGLVVLVALAYFLANEFWIPKHATPETATRAGAALTAFNPPPHSIAVLPFVNMSGDKEQEYFSEGLTEELLNSLSRINELQVAARTSSFSFQGEHPDIGTVAHKLNVGAVLEGSVRRSANTVRITAQLVNGVTGFHIWSQTYDRDLGDVLKLQTEIATAVASALKVTLLGDLAAKIELGGTRNPAALDAYLRGLKPARIASSAADDQAAIAAYTEAIRLDPDYAVAYAARSRAQADYGDYFATGAASHESYEEALTDAQKAIALAPGLGEGHAALAYAFVEFLDFTRANEEYERALALAPGNAAILYDSSSFTAWMGHPDAAIAAARRAVTLDPLNFASYSNLGWVLWIARRYPEALAASEQSIALEPDSAAAYDVRGGAYYMLGDFQSARRSCEVKSDYAPNQVCLALTYDKLGRHADAEAMRQKLKGAYSAYWNAEIYAQRGDIGKALEWLETALRVRDSKLINLKTDPLLDGLRREARFQAIERALKFPN